MSDDLKLNMPAHDEDPDEELSPFEALETAAVSIAAIGLSVLAFILLLNAPRLHRGIEAFATNPRIEALSAQSGAGQRSGLADSGASALAPGGAAGAINQPAPAPGATGGAAPPAEEPDNWMDACFQRGKPAAKAPETPTEFFVDVYKFAVRTNCPAIVSSAINLCFMIAGLLLVLAVLLYALSKALEAAERKCKKRKKKKRSGWKRFLSWIISILCFLVTVLKWITLILAVISVIASIVLFIYCLVQLIAILI